MKRFSEQTLYILGGILVLPFAPFLYWQGWRTRKKVGRLPDAGGETSGHFGECGMPGGLNLLAIGESTVAGVGAGTHAEALAGQLARFLSLHAAGTPWAKAASQRARHCRDWSPPRPKRRSIWLSSPSAATTLSR
jgi:hypothetical protein